MRSFVFVYILAMLGAIVFLTVQYSFWVACVITYIFTMLVVALRGNQTPRFLMINTKKLSQKVKGRPHRKPSMLLEQSIRSVCLKTLDLAT